MTLLIEALSGFCLLAGGLRAVRHEGSHDVGGFDHHQIDVGLLLLGEAAQHEVGRVHPARRAIDSHSQAGKGLRPQRLDDGAVHRRPGLKAGQIDGLIVAEDARIVLHILADVDQDGPGPPGSGKTHLARCMAGSAAVPFLGLDGSRLISMWLGVGSIKVMRLFANARKLGAPADEGGGSSTV